jgi:hypothetical protein
MDSLGVDVHVLSPYSGFYNYHLDTGVAIATSKDSNDEISQMTKTWRSLRGSRFTADAGCQAAIAELERVMIRLGFGV